MYGHPTAQQSFQIQLTVAIMEARDCDKLVRAGIFKSLHAQNDAIYQRGFITYDDYIENRNRINNGEKYYAKK